MKKILSFVLFFVLVMPAQAQSTSLLVCELTEFPTGSAYLSRAMQDNFINNCASPLRALSQDESVLFRGYTNHEEWAGGNNYGRDTKNTSFGVNEASERPLSEQRAFNAYSMAVNDPEVSFDTERSYYTGTAGENLKTVRVFRIPKGTSAGDIAKILDALEGLSTNLDRLTVIATAARDNAADAATASREARDASRGAEDWSRKNYEMLVKMTPPRWFISVGVETWSKFEEGFTLSLGRNFLNQRLDIYFEAYVENGTHLIGLYERPLADQPVDHIATWYSGMIFAKVYLKRVGPAEVFVEIGGGTMYIQANGPPETSIGWHHNAPIVDLGIGVKISAGKHLALFISGSENAYKAPYSAVSPNEFSTGEAKLSFRAKAGLSVML